jgi:hypothetical protein
LTRALPRQFVSVDDQKSSVLMQVSKEMLAMSSKLEQGVPIDDRAVASWWRRARCPSRADPAESVLLHARIRLSET